MKPVHLDWAIPDCAHTRVPCSGHYWAIVLFDTKMVTETMKCGLYSKLNVRVWATFLWEEEEKNATQVSDVKPHIDYLYLNNIRYLILRYWTRTLMESILQDGIKLLTSYFLELKIDICYENMQDEFLNLLINFKVTKI